jgi:hypothetical protein
LICNWAGKYIKFVNSVGVTFLLGSLPLFNADYKLFKIIALFHVMRSLKLIGRFYSDIFLANFLVTLSCVYLHWEIGTQTQYLSHYLIGILFWYKVITLILIFYLALYYKKHELYYYQNLGVSKLRLIISISVFDFAIWLIIYIIAYNLL